MRGSGKTPNPAESRGEPCDGEISLLHSLFSERRKWLGFTRYTTLYLYLHHGRRSDKTRLLGVGLHDATRLATLGPLLITR
jgi:hypothetical protein